MGGITIVIFKIYTCDATYYLVDCGIEYPKDSGA